MQHRMQLRLIRGNKIVGYAIYTRSFVKDTIVIIPHYTTPSYILCEEILYDSFEFRSPFKDKNNQWLWEGDRIQSNPPHKWAIEFGEFHPAADVVCYGFYLEDSDGMQIGLFPNEKHIEKIGTIHE